MQEPPVDSLLQRLSSPLSLERQKAVDALRQRLQGGSGASSDAALQLLQRLCTEAESPALTWHTLHGDLLAITCLLSDAAGLVVPEPLLESLQRLFLAHLEHDQLRVRQAVGAALAVLAKAGHASAALTSELADRVVLSIQRNFHRGNSDDASSSVVSDERVRVATSDSGDDVRERLRQRGLRPDAEGWKALETSLAAFSGLVEAAASCSAPQLALVLRACGHRNRFVRQAAFDCVAVLTGVKGVRLDDLRDVLVAGLADNWSQVRLAASIAARRFVEAHMDTGASLEAPQEDAIAALVPGMCLNRYYVAEGVRSYSLTTWKMVSGGVRGGGAALLDRHADAVVAYYACQAAADNHAVREAACYCMAELATKVQSGGFRQHVPTLLSAMLDCFRDESWPVRDAACVALGDFVSGFADEARPSLPDLVPLWTQHLADNIASVRRNSAVALGKAMAVYGDDLVADVDATLAEMLPQARNQPPDEARPPTMQSKGAFGVVKQRQHRDEDDDAAHTDQVMFSCGSLAPKLRRGGGCMDHGFARERQAWEVSDGAVHLLVQMAVVSPGRAEAHLDALAGLTDLSSFSQHGLLKETIFKALVGIAEGLGKKVFKRHLEMFVEPLLVALADEHHRLAQHAAADALEKLSSWLSEAVFMFRLSEDQQRRLRQSPLVRLAPTTRS